MKRTIKPPAGKSHITVAAAAEAARVVRRDTATGRFVIEKSGMPARRGAASKKR